MTIQAKPAIYYFVDELGSNQHPDPANMPPNTNGYSDGDIPPAKEYNTYGRGAGLWHRWLDQNALLGQALLSQPDALFSAFPARVAYTTGGTLTQTLSSGGYYYVKGRIVDATVARLTALSPTLSPYAFAPNRWTHFYLKADGEVVVEAVAINTAATPDGTRIWVGTAKSNGVTVTAWEDGLQEPPRVGRAWGFEQGLRIHNQDQDTRDLAFYMEGSYQWRIRHTGDFGNTTLKVDDDATTVWNFGNGTTPQSFGRRISTTFDPGGGNTLMFLRHNGAGGVTVSLVANQGTALKLESTVGGTGTPLVLVPHASVTTANEVGTMHPEWGGKGDMMYRDIFGAVRRMWATQNGITYDSGPVNSIDVITGSVELVNRVVSMGAGRKYWIFMHCRVGRTAGSTRNVQFTGTAAGQNLWWSPHTVKLFQGGAAGELEHTFFILALFTSPAPAPMNVILRATPTGGAGDLNVAHYGVHVFGALD